MECARVFLRDLRQAAAQAAGTSAVNTASNGAATLQFDLTDADRTVTVKVGVSSVSVRNAQANLKAEGETLAFDDAKNASGLWNDRLNTIQIDRPRRPQR